MNEDIKKLEKMYEEIKPLVEKMKAKYPLEVNIEGFEPALTNDIAIIVLEVLTKRDKELVRDIKKMKLDLEVYPNYAPERNATIEDIINLIHKA